jgi:hypothetical protein
MTSHLMLLIDEPDFLDQARGPLKLSLEFLAGVIEHFGTSRHQRIPMGLPQIGAPLFQANRT